jgi:hypothetical protein
MLSGDCVNVVAGVVWKGIEILSGDCVNVVTGGCVGRNCDFEW